MGLDMGNDTRALRYRGRHALRFVTDVDRCRDCGRATVNPGGAVGVRQTDDGTVGLAGLASCGRIWLCPVCNAKVMARRALDVGLAVTWASANRLRLIWGSLTVQHDFDDALAPMLDIQREAWRLGVVNSRIWRRNSTTATVRHEHVARCEPGCDRKRDTVDTGADGRVGYIRAAELTIGRNGWHPHFHPLMFWRGDRDSAQAYAASVVGGWLDGVASAGGFALGNGAQQLRVLEPHEYSEPLSGYVTKATYDAAAMAYEVAWSQGKTGAGRRGRKRALGTTSHWALLAELERVGCTGEYSDTVQRWWELEDATKGHRMLTWSRGLRDFVGLGVERTDEEIADEEVGTKEDTVCYISDRGWATIRDMPDVVTGILSTLESTGWAGLRSYLDAHGVEYFTLEGASL